MPPRSLIDPLTASDSGGVAGRRGYIYQDHVAAGFVLDMLGDPQLAQVECETGDDIVLRWTVNGSEVYEYVQVKITEKDSKWSISEVMGRTDGGREGTSIAEKSLACDIHTGRAIFRFVSQRDVRGELGLLKVEREKRPPIAEAVSRLASRMGSKYKQVRSGNGRTLEDWAVSLLWQVEGSEHTLQQKNINKLLKLSEEAGERPSFSQAEEVYQKLLSVVAEAADASRVTDPDAKAIPSDDAQRWWTLQLSQIRARSRHNLKVYTVAADAFFKELHKVDEPAIRRNLGSYDAEFDGGVWRCSELAEYLLDWLPELTLPARVLAEYSHIEARRLVARAAETLGHGNRLDDERLVAELMLHSILRHYHGSEPIACKLFYVAPGGLISTSAHIVHDPKGDQLWLGQAKLMEVHNKSEVVERIKNELLSTLDRNILKGERRLIVQLRDPQHLRATGIEHAFSPHAKLDDLLQVLHIPILIAYDSDVIGAGYELGYEERLREEVCRAYEDVKGQLPENVRNLHVHIFLVPIESAEQLISAFASLLRRN